MELKVEYEGAPHFQQKVKAAREEYPERTRMDDILWPNQRFGISQSPPTPLINHHTYIPHLFPHKPHSCMPVSVSIKSSLPPPHHINPPDSPLDSKNKIQSPEFYIVGVILLSPIISLVRPVSLLPF